MIQSQKVIAWSSGPIEMDKLQPVAVRRTPVVRSSTIVVHIDTSALCRELRGWERTEHAHRGMNRHGKLLALLVPHLKDALARIERESQVKSPTVGHVSCRSPWRLRRSPIVPGSVNEHNAGVIGADGLIDPSTECARAVGRSADRSDIEEHHHRHRQFSRLVHHKIHCDVYTRGAHVPGGLGWLIPMRRGTGGDLHGDDRGVGGNASVLPVGAVAPVPGGNAGGCGPVADGIPGRQPGAGEERLIYLLPGVNGAASVGVARGGGGGIVEEVEDVGDPRAAILVAEIVALPVDAAVQNCDDDARSRHAQRGDSLVDTRFNTNAVESEADISDANDQKEGKDCPNYRDHSAFGLLRQRLDKAAGGGRPGSSPITGRTEPTARERGWPRSFMGLPPRRIASWRSLAWRRVGTSVPLRHRPSGRPSPRGT